VPQNRGQYTGLMCLRTGAVHWVDVPQNRGSALG